MFRGHRFPLLKTAARLAVPAFLVTGDVSSFVVFLFHVQKIKFTL
jgi:hypothetical protein